MRPCLAVLVALLVALQLTAAAARSAAPCCAQGCADAAHCLVTACTVCHACAAVPVQARLPAAVAGADLPAEPALAALPAGGTDIWRPPR